MLRLIILHTVDGRNPARPVIYEILWNMGYSQYQLVQDFFHQQYYSRYCMQVSTLFPFPFITCFPPLKKGSYPTAHPIYSSLLFPPKFQLYKCSPINFQSYCWFRNPAPPSAILKNQRNKHDVYIQITIFTTHLYCSNSTCFAPNAWNHQNPIASNVFSTSPQPLLHLLMGGRYQLHKLLPRFWSPWSCHQLAESFRRRFSRIDF